MTVTVNVHEAKTQLARLLVRVELGEEVIIARLVAIADTPQRRVPGSGCGEIWIAPDFDAPLPENVLDSFHDRA